MIRAPTPTCHDDPAGTGLEPADGGSMWISYRFRSSLEQAGLAGVEAVMDSDEGQCLRALEDRENWYLRLAKSDIDSRGEPTRGMFLKKHHVRTWRSRLRARRGVGPGETAGRVEARNIRRLTDDGIDVMDLAAYGERLCADGRLESFVLTEELESHVPLDDFLNARFGGQPLDRAARRDLDHLLRSVADVAARLHAAGYNHRDLYCCHFFVRETATGQFEIRVIDLQRVQHRRHWRRRWLVKDLAQLGYSAPRSVITCKHRVAFMRYYRGVKQLRAADKRFIRTILAKQRRMERKLGTGT